MNKELRRIQDELAAGRNVLVTTSGVSMEPLLHDKHKKNATRVLIAPSVGACKIGDMPLVRMEEGKYFLHRIIRIEEKQDETYYITRGDNCITTETVPSERVLGVVTDIYYPTHQLSVNDRRYRIYIKIWTIIYPVRKLYKKSRNFCGKCKRFLVAKRKNIG